MPRKIQYSYILGEYYLYASDRPGESAQEVVPMDGDLISTHSIEGYESEVRSDLNHLDLELLTMHDAGFACIVQKGKYQ